MTSPELRAREAEFEERRRRVLRAFALLIAVFAVGIAVLVAAKELRPESYDDVIPIFVLAAGAGFLALWRTTRTHWRCPACDARWKFDETLASGHWNHCGLCGAPLRATLVEGEREREARSRLALDPVSDEVLVAGFLRRRRRGALAAGVAVLAGVAALMVVQRQGWGPVAEQVVVALFMAVAAAVFMHSARCPRCRVGIVAGKQRHCGRCGLELRPDLDGAGSGRTSA